MQLNTPVREARFLRRYKRFFADVLLDGQVVVAHVPNTGSLKTCLFADARCLITTHDDPKRKLKATLHFLETPTSWVGVDTSLPNRLVREAWESGLIPHWRPYSVLRPEYKVSPQTRLDMVLAHSEEHLKAGHGLHYVEIKNVTYALGTRCLFPDAVSERGQKHLRELIELKKSGSEAELVFVVQRQDCASFAPADAIDPEYGRLLRQAIEAGVIVNAYACKIELTGLVQLDPRPLTINL